MTFLSLVPLSKEKGLSIPIVGLDKVVHALFYLVLTFLIFRSYRLNIGNQRIRKKAVIMIVLGIICYGICIELAQEAFFLGRHFEILDIIANIIGTLSGYLLINFVIKDEL